VNIRVAINDLRISFPWLLRARVEGNGKSQASGAKQAEISAIPVEDIFHALLMLERRRAERSRKPFILVLLDAHQENGTARGILHQAFGALGRATRETDSLGWYKDGMVLGLICTEVGDGDPHAAVDILRNKIRNLLQERLGSETEKKVAISWYVFPEQWERDDSGWMASSALYPEWPAQTERKSVSRAAKRAIDIVGSGALLVLLSPILAIIAVLIKLTSKGPVFFAQERLGQFGVRFKCLKFRTMYVNNDSTIHQDFVRNLISAKNDAPAAENGSSEPSSNVYKIVKDPRVTPVGQFLRKTSLDELPQFWNIVRNEMSLVGPRPPVPYEFEMYQFWHRRRVLEVKPGITGLWQVSGRSRVGFDDMVRLDLRYCRSWSLWLDLKIILATPWAVVSGEGAH
jgi:lipopolysaccharide/colanic/teichoic acid biosynthesis glycosyltransferase